jgi:acyl carrier protein
VTRLPDLEARVLRIVADALDHDPGEVGLHASLIDDLGAESIDFIDIQYRVETEFGLELAEDELWRGAIDLDDPAVLDGDRVRPEALARLRERLPHVDWQRFPGGLKRADLPRLITPRTVVEALEPLLPEAASDP